MSVSAQRYVGGTLGFAFAAVWVAAGLTSALACVIAAGLGYGAVRLRERGWFTGLVPARAAVRRELHARLAASPRAVRSTARPQHTRRQTREPVAAAPAPEPATYGW